jgi:hypothetical protein
MVMVRSVLHCKPGKVGDLVEKFKAAGEVMKEMGLEPFRIFTDVSGEEFWTLVLEREYQDLGDFQATESRVLADDRLKAVMAGYHDIVTKGRREIYTVEA